MPKIIVNAFLTLDGVMQAPGGPDEDRDGGFAHGGWQAPYFDDVMGRLVTEGITDADGAESQATTGRARRRDRRAPTRATASNGDRGPRWSAGVSRSAC